MTILEAYQIIYKENIKSEALLKASLTDWDITRELKERIKECKLKNNDSTTEEICESINKMRLIINAYNLLKKEVLDVKEEQRIASSEKKLFDIKKRLKKVINQAKEVKTYVISKKYADAIQKMLSKCEEVDYVLEAADAFLDYNKEIKYIYNEYGDLLKLIDLEKQLDDKNIISEDIVKKVTIILKENYHLLVDPKKYKAVASWIKDKYVDFYKSSLKKEKLLNGYIEEFINETNDRITRTMDLHRKRSFKKYGGEIAKIFQKLDNANQDNIQELLLKYEELKLLYRKDLNQEIDIRNASMKYLTAMKRSTISREKYSKLCNTLLSYVGKDCAQTAADTEEYENEIAYAYSGLMDDKMEQYKKIDSKLEKIYLSVKYKLIDRINYLAPYVSSKEKELNDRIFKIDSLSLKELLKLDEALEEYKLISYPNKNANALKDKINLYLNAIMLNNGMVLPYDYDYIRKVLYSDNRTMDLFCKELDEYCQKTMKDKKYLNINNEELTNKKAELIKTIKGIYNIYKSQIGSSILLLNIISKEDLQYKMENLDKLELAELTYLLNIINQLLNDLLKKPVRR